MFQFDNESLALHIVEAMKPIEEFIHRKDLYFMKNTPGSREGVYVFSDEQGYHFVYSERGIETRHKLTDDVFEITYWTIYEFVQSAAFEMLEKQIAKIKNQREYLFEQCLLLMEKAGPNFKKAAQIHIDEILKENPL